MPPRKRPNFLWISWEDAGPTLGCFGDPYAVTPNLDRLAAEGVRFPNVFTHSPVCAPSRSGIITGMFPTTIGTHNMRSKAVPPPHVKCFTEYLRAAGYYCTNNAKTDYNFPTDPEVSSAGPKGAPLTAWDECDPKAHWRNRPDPDQPFFAVFNIGITHESKIRDQSEHLLSQLKALSREERHDPEKAPVPPYLPDTPVVRRDIARYYDLVTLMDKRVGHILAELEEDGLLEDTIVWFWADHGPGLPRMKRWVYDTGIHAPLIIRIPEKFRKWACPDNPDRIRPGSIIHDLVGFVDFAPTMLSLAGVPIPKHMQGRAFLGPQKAPPRRFVYAARDRMDETYDIIRAIRDDRFKYIRNFAPHLPYAQVVEYAEETPSLQEWRRLAAEGKLNDVQRAFFAPTKPVEELYDTKADPYETRNLANDPRYQHVLRAMRRELYRWVLETGDLGLIPEPELARMMRPEGRWQRVAPPELKIMRQSEREAEVALECPTPGASIAYRLEPGTEGGRWLLYVQPVVVRKEQTLVAKACRPGCLDSPEVRWRLGEPLPAPGRPPEPIPDWRTEVDRSGVLRRLLELKMLDGKGEGAIPAYLKALKDGHPAVRYWAIVGIHHACKDEGRRRELSAVLRARLSDPSPTVRVAAAHALADWGWASEGLKALVELLSHPEEFVRLYAINALRHLGEKARPALEAVKKALHDPSHYVQRVARTILRRFRMLPE